MYIRRKVFSLLQDENGEERYFSTTDYELLDEYDEKLYAESEDEEEEKKDKHIGRKIAIGAAVAPVAAYGAYRGGRALERAIDKKRVAKLEKVEEKTEKIGKKLDKLNKRLEDNKVDKFQQNVEGGVKKGAKWVGKQGKDFGNWVATQWKGGKEGKHSTRNKIMMIAAPVAAAGATYGAVKGIKALKNRKNNEEEESKKGKK